MDDEKRLINQILSGDRRSFEVLIGRYKRLVGHMVFKMIQQAEDREEIAQDVFLKVHQNLAHFRGESKLSTWIARIAHRTCLNYLKRKRLPTTDLSAEESQLAIDQADRPDKLLEKDQRAQFLRRQIACLPPQYGTVLTLFHLEELEIKEISTILEMPTGTVKNYLFRGRKLLKERLLRKEAIWN